MRLNFRAIVALNSVSLTVGTALVAVGLFVMGVPLLELIELKTYDLRFRSRSALPPTPAVALGLIDEPGGRPRAGEGVVIRVVSA